jgi:large subunit ribosomal protein L9
MYVILLERIEKLGAMGDVVRVKDGYARNYLLPQGKALRSNEANRKLFEAQREMLEARNAERKAQAEQQAANIDGKTFVVIRQAGESGQLYGSVSTRDIAQIINDETGANVSRNQVVLDAPIKTIGLTQVRIALHPEVPTTITLNVARSEDEAAAQARGEDLTIPVDEREAALEAAGFDAEGAEEEEENPVSNADE